MAAFASHPIKTWTARIGDAVPRSLLAYVFVAGAITHKNGHYTESGLQLLAGAAILLWMRRARLPQRWSLVTSVLVFLVFMLKPAGIYLTNPWWAVGLSAFALGLVPLVLWVLRDNSPITALWITVGAAFAAKVALLIASPAPVIDVWGILQEGADALGRGDNPYTAVYTDVYKPGETVDVYVYMPAILFVTAPARWIFSDVRVAMLLCEAITAWLLWALARNGRSERKMFAAAVALLFALHPRSLFVLEQSWTEPIVALLFIGALAAAVKRRWWLAAALAGIFFASKQYLPILGPLVLVAGWTALGSARRRVIAGSVAAGAALVITLPLLVWDPSAFVNDVVGFHVDSPVRRDALTLTSSVLRYTKVALPGWASVLAAMTAGAAGVWMFLRDRTYSGLAFACGWTLLISLLFQKHAFCNYYYLVGTLLLSGVAMVGYGQREQAA